jgi:hypothetical protein
MSDNEVVILENENSVKPNVIRQINTGNAIYNIDAAYLDGHTFEEIQRMVQGGVSTYVISESKKNAEGYDDVVRSNDNTIITTRTILNELTNSSDSYKIGDIILMEEVSDGSKVFDRWVSAVDGVDDEISGGSDDEIIILAVLETQVATHHHTISATAGKGDALTGIDKTTLTTKTLATVGENVDVLTNVSGSFVTSVDYDSNGSNNLTLVGTSGSGSVGHSHTVNSHNHSVSVNPNDFVASTISVYTTLNSDTFVTHTHENNINVAGSFTNVDSITYVTDNHTSDLFVKTLSSNNEDTSLVSLVTNSNVSGLSTSEQTSDDVVGDVVKTTSVDSHTHAINITTDESFVTSVSLASDVVVSVDYTEPTVAPSVLTSIAFVERRTALLGTGTDINSTSGSFLNNWSCSVDSNGVLFFETNTSSALVSVELDQDVRKIDTTIIGEVVSVEQNAGSCIVSTATQSYTSDKVTLIGDTEAAGAHVHGFSHTHIIPEHTHDIPEHTHKYVRNTVGDTGSAITSLNTATYIPHIHTENVSVAGAHKEGETLTYINSGEKTSVVHTLKNEQISYTTTSSSPGTDVQYVGIAGEIVFPGLSVTTGSVSTETTTVTPAVDSKEKAIAAIAFTSGKFVTDVNIDNKTSGNIGGI